MMRTLKTDFHLHTHHSDNRDRMTPAEYVTLARRFGYDVLGFCDHHHNLTQASWAALQAEVRAAMTALSPSELLLTTGYEATWMTGHLCVLGKQTFDGEHIPDCDRQMWSPANTRILAHPDNNLCAWRLPLPVAVQGVEVINSGQDPYSVDAGSPCNGLATYQRYLLLNHKVAAVAQSDCHQRAVFGRAWTGIMVDDDAPLHWEVVQQALQQGHTFAAMGDMPIRVWTENGCGPGDTLTDAAESMLYWEVPNEAEVTVYVADRPLAHSMSVSDLGTGMAGGHVRLSHNGPHWLLVKRGLAWAVSTPIWVSNQEVTTAPIRRALAEHTAVKRMVDGLRRYLDWLAALDLAPEQTPYPVAHYVEWLRAQLPAMWTESDPAFTGPGDPVDWAMARLRAAQEIATPIVHDLYRTYYQSPGYGVDEPRLLVAAPYASLPHALYRATVDLPREATSLRVTTAQGREIPALATPIAGERDPLHGKRSRSQMAELVTWLTRGEIHEYLVRDCQLTCDGGELRLTADLWPAYLGYTPEPNPAAAQALLTALADPAVLSFFVHLRMPRRFALIFELDESAPVDQLVLRVADAPREKSGEKSAEEGTEEDKRTLRFFQDDALADDPSEWSLIVQLT
jgi:hypothetical protein